MNEETVRAAIGKTSNLAGQVRRLIQIRTQTHWETGLKRGKLNPKRIWSIKADCVDVFRKRNTAEITTDTAIVFLGDISGSMGTAHKYEHLCAAYCMINSVGTALGFPYELLCFTEGWRSESGEYNPDLSKAQPLFITNKSFGQKVTQEEIISDFKRMDDYMGDNPDGEALLWAYSRLMQRPEKKKILVVLSDGQPATSADGDSDAHLKEVCRSIESSPVILYGIGLMSRAVSKYYKRNMVCNSATDLEKMFLNLIQKEVLTHV